ncbi:NAD(P)H-dependent glycerol-3-phosphate dehydrogenase [bacterium]|nr:NAD(P)H-dependent glycerol-3-phosphate dehydrogenase [bacterium]
MVKSAAILGAGSWGITLAILLFEKGFFVKVWEFERKQAEILRKKCKLRFLPWVDIPREIEITSSIPHVLEGVQLVVVALPSHVVRRVAKKIAEVSLPEDIIIVTASKGLEDRTLLRISQVLSEELPEKLRERIVVLSGPSHAEEVSRKIPTTVVVASTNEKLNREVQKIFFTPYFRVYTNPDIVGVEMGGALKNIIAIAAGISDGLGLGDNSKAGLITRGVVEITRLGKALGAKPATFSGLSGMGDLIVTCTSGYSRNRNFGEKIGQGKTLKKALSEIKMVVEGIRTTKAAYQLAKKYKVSMPITNEVYSVLFKNKETSQAVRDLMLREAKPELEEDFLKM